MAYDSKRCKDCERAHVTRGLLPDCYNCPNAPILTKKENNNG